MSDTEEAGSTNKNWSTLLVEECPILSGFELEVPCSRLNYFKDQREHILKQLANPESKWLRDLPDFLSTVLSYIIRNNQLSRSAHENLVMLNLMKNCFPGHVGPVWSVHPLLEKFYVDLDQDAIDMTNRYCNNEHPFERNPVLNFWLYRRNSPNARTLERTFRSVCSMNHNAPIRHVICYQDLLCHILGEILSLRIPPNLRRTLVEFDWTILNNDPVDLLFPTPVSMRSYMEIVEFLQGPFKQQWIAFLNNEDFSTDTPEELLESLVNDDGTPLAALQEFLETFSKRYVQPEPTRIDLPIFCKSYSDIYYQAGQDEADRASVGAAGTRKKNEPRRNHFALWSPDIFAKRHVLDQKKGDRSIFSEEAPAYLAEIVANGYPSFFKDAEVVEVVTVHSSDEERERLGPAHADHRRAHPRSRPYSGLHRNERYNASAPVPSTFARRSSSPSSVGGNASSRKIGPAGLKTTGLDDEGLMKRPSDSTPASASASSKKPRPVVTEPRSTMPPPTRTETPMFNSIWNKSGKVESPPSTSQTRSDFLSPDATTAGRNTSSVPRSTGASYRPPPFSAVSQSTPGSARYSESPTHSGSSSATTVHQHDPFVSLFATNIAKVPDSHKANGHIPPITYIQIFEKCASMWEHLSGNGLCLPGASSLPDDHLVTSFNDMIKSLFPIGPVSDVSDYSTAFVEAFGFIFGYHPFQK